MYKVIRLLAAWCAAGVCAALPANGYDGPPTRTAGVTGTSGYAGADACAVCHPRETRRWQNSHHRQSMQPADESTVLGAFDNRSVVGGGRTTRFFRRGAGYFVETDGPDGRRGVFAVRFTFGFQPLQQYLLELADGRLQALDIAWDSRPAAVGGQRWFHVYGDELINADDVLHWTRPGQNWNSMCADCHSTGLIKNFDPATHRFATTWAEDNVACEACHGPATQHVAWAMAGGDAGGPDPILRFDERQGVRWIEQADGNRRRSRARTTQVEINACAACHARRSRIDAAPPAGAELLDGFRPALIEPPLYHVDGQIRDEVYVYGSFLQSRMHGQGVTCSDCHEPHGLNLRAPGDGVCLQCHAARSFAGPAHHLHAAGSPGADCIACHMPATTYMQIDVRHDHGFGVPRPDLAARYGTPDACTNCHVDRDAEWAANRLRERGKLRPPVQWRDRLAVLLADRPAAQEALVSLVNDPAVPGIVRATAIARAPALSAAAWWSQLAELAGHDDPLIRWAVARAWRVAPPPIIATHAPGMLADPVRSVRIAAAAALTALDPSQLPVGVRRSFVAVADEALQAERVNGERAEAQTNIGNWERRRRRPERAERAFRTALKLNPLFVPAYVNLADLYRMQRKDAAGEVLLREALVQVPGQPSLHYALGLLLVRDGRLGEARTELGRAAEAAAATPRMALALVLLLESLGEPDAALRSLETARQRFGVIRELEAVRARLLDSRSREASGASSAR